MRNHPLKIGIIFLCLLMGLSGIVRAQAQPTMTVVHIAGKVSMSSTKQPLQLGGQLTDKDLLTFADKQGKVIAWKPEVGLVFMHPGESASTHGGGLQGAAESFVDAKTTIANGARLEHFTATSQLKAHFQGRKYLVLGKTWLIADAPFQTQGDTVFMLKFRNPKENFQTGQPFLWASDTLRIDRASLLSLNGRELDPLEISDYRLWWYSMKGRKFGEITYFDFVFADEAVVIADIKQLLSLMKKHKIQEKRDAVRTLVGLGFGEPDAHNYAQWIAAHFPELK